MTVLSIGASVSSLGSEPSTVNDIGFQSLQLPALSCTWVLSVCGPAPMIVAALELWTVPLSSCQCTVPDRPESPSLPVTGILWPLATGAPGAAVVSVGLTLSILTGSSRHTE